MCDEREEMMERANEHALTAETFRASKVMTVKEIRGIARAGQAALVRLHKCPIAAAQHYLDIVLSTSEQQSLGRQLIGKG